MRVLLSSGRSILWQDDVFRAARLRIAEDIVPERRPGLAETEDSRFALDEACGSRA
jgi:hypothetical protein